MDERTDAPSAADLASEAGMLVVGLTTLTIQIFPFALPLLILVIGPLAVLALAGLLLALPILVPLWLARRVMAAIRRRRDGAAVPRQLTGASAGAADGRRASGREARQPRAVG
jgi:NADH:ubiquinone oxidoreductase subunit H